MAGEGDDTRRHLGYLAFVRANPLFLGFGFTLTFFSSFGQTYFVSTFGDSIRATFDLTEAEWGASYGGATAAAGLLLVWVGRYIDRPCFASYYDALRIRRDREAPQAVERMSAPAE